MASMRDPKAVESHEENSRRRQEESIQIRKNKRMQNLQKRRAMARGTKETPSATSEKSNVVTSEMGTYQESAGKVATVEQLPSIAANLKKMTPAQRFEATRSVRRLLSRQEHPPAAEVIEAGLVPILVQELGLVTEEKTQFEAAWALTNIASTEHTRVIVSNGAVPPLVKLMMSKSPDIREQCLWCLGNVAGDGHDMRDLVLKVPGAVNNLLMNIKHAASDSLLANATWTLSNFCRGKPQPALDMIKPALPYLAKLITHTKLDVVGDACWALSYISDGDDDRIQACLDLNIVPTLMRLLQSEKVSVVTPALRTLGNIVSGNDSQTQAVLDGGCFQAITPLLQHSKRTVRKEACWALSNIAAGIPAQVDQLVTQTNILQRVMELLETDDFEVRKEAAWVISNICTGGSSANITDIIGMGALKTIIAVMDSSDHKITTVSLEAIEAIFKKIGNSEIIMTFENEGGVDKLETLQDHSSDSIYQKSKNLIETYFNQDEEDDEEDEDDDACGENQDPSDITSSKGFSSDPFAVDQNAADPFGAGGFNTASQPAAVSWGF